MIEAPKIFIGIPILNRLDLLAKCIDCLDVPAEVVVVNNNSVDASFKEELITLATSKGFEVLHQERNLGVARSWNLIARIGFNRRYEWVFVGSNDCFLHPGSLRAAIEFPKDEDVAIWHLHSANFFLVNRQTIERIGWFDENFYPAYKEDQDYAYRCQLAGYRRVDVAGAGAEHVGSATIRSNPDYAERNECTHFNWNYNHYVMKWGGNAGAERFKRPYDQADKDHRWWPTPGDTIERRDWDAAFHRKRRLSALAKTSSLQALGLMHGTDKATYHGYLPIYERYFAPLRGEPITLLEIGVGDGASLRVWRDFFSCASIVGVDRDSRCACLEEPRVRILIGDAADEAFLRSITGDLGRLDVVIDDGGHTMAEQLNAFRNLFPQLASGGIYVIEDLHTSYQPEYGGNHNASAETTVGYLKTCVDKLCTADGCPDRQIAELSFFPSICFIRKACLIE